MVKINGQHFYKNRQLDLSKKKATTKNKKSIFFGIINEAIPIERIRSVRRDMETIAQSIALKNIKTKWRCLARHFRGKIQQKGDDEENNPII